MQHPCSSVQVDTTTDAPPYLVVTIILNSLALVCMDVNSLKNTILNRNKEMNMKCYKQKDQCL